MGAVAEQLSYEQYLALAAATDDVLEYHDGVVVSMVAPSYEHARIVGQLVRLLGRSSKQGCVALPSGLKVRIEATNRTLVPDVTVVCGAGQRSQLDNQAIVNPVIIFEVLSPSTEAYDQDTKLHQYRRIPSLREYVTVAQDHRFASICRRVGDLWAFEDVEAGGVLRLEGLGVELALDDVYGDELGVIVP
ncbi:MAG TPA: Uma2 family endonuclease [Enhygromyxa sp.]|nr:Uma2 family endonuclease [Enhygromyxa sp.]